MRQIPTLSAMDRREFLRRTAMAGVGLGLLPLSEATASESPSVKRYVRLGRTGLEISDIGFGGSRLREEKLVHHALDRGINYFDSAESYTGGTSEEVLGRALRGKRDRAVLVSKLKAGARSSREEMMRTLEGSLSRLQTDRIDIYLNHAVNDVARLQNPEWPEFVAQAKQAGKIRFAGMSGHGGRLVECLDHALDHDLVDVVLVGLLSTFHESPRLRCRSARPAACARQGGREGGRSGGDEDAARRAAQRHATLRVRQRHLPAGGLSLGALESECPRTGRDDEEHGDDRRVSRCLGLDLSGACRPGASRAVRGQERIRPVSLWLLRLPFQLPARRSHSGGVAHAHVCGRLWRSRFRPRGVRTSRNERVALYGLRDADLRWKLSPRSRHSRVARRTGSTAGLGCRCQRGGSPASPVRRPRSIDLPGSHHATRSPILRSVSTTSSGKLGGSRPTA